MRDSVYLVNFPFGKTSLFILEPPVKPSFYMIVVCDYNLNTLFTKLCVITSAYQSFLYLVHFLPTLILFSIFALPFSAYTDFELLDV